MKLLRSTHLPPQQQPAPQLKARKSARKVGLTIWLSVVTVMLGVVIFLLIHLAGTLSKLVAGLGS